MVAAMFLNGRGFLTQVSLGFVLEVMIVENGLSVWMLSNTWSLLALCDVHCIYEHHASEAHQNRTPGLVLVTIISNFVEQNLLNEILKCVSSSLEVGSFSCVHGTQ